MTEFQVFPDETKGPVNPDGDRVSLQYALNHAEPGDTITLNKGLYVTPVVMRRSGTAEAPIIIRGKSGNRTLFDGRTHVDDLPRQKPDFSQHGLITLLGASHIKIQKIAFDNCYPVAIRLIDATHIAIESCIFTRFSYAISAGTDPQPDSTRFITVHDCRAIQDPEGDLWTGRVSWQSVKQQHMRQADQRHRNGAFFHARNTFGDILINKTNVAQAFNGIQFYNRHSIPDRNKNIFITGCRFAYLRDNAVEPEWRVDNLWVVNNEFFNCHNPFSMDWVIGGHRYYLGNRILNRVRPGAHHQGNRGGTIYKFVTDKNVRLPDGAFYSAYNAVLTRTEYAKQGTTRRWAHANNAISIVQDGPHTDPHKRMFGQDFVDGGDLVFFDDLTDHPDAAKQSKFLGRLKTVDAPLFEPPVLRPDFLGTTDAWDGALVLSGQHTRHRTAPMEIALISGGTLAVAGGYAYAAGAPQTVVDEMQKQSAPLWPDGVGPAAGTALNIV
ncbi:MAG: hypothetical protein AAF318_08820 [Pseudomonadota bacterium]